MTPQELYNQLFKYSKCPNCREAGMKESIDMGETEVITCQCGYSYMMHHDTKTAEVYTNGQAIIR